MLGFDISTRSMGVAEEFLTCVGPKRLEIDGSHSVWNLMMIGVNIKISTDG